MCSEGLGFDRFCVNSSYDLSVKPYYDTLYKDFIKILDIKKTVHRDIFL